MQEKIEKNLFLPGVQEINKRKKISALDYCRIKKYNIREETYIIKTERKIKMLKINKLSVLLNLFICFMAGILAGQEEVKISFAKGKWDKSKWLEVKSPRWSYLGKMVQNEDHIINQTPDLPDEVIFKKYGNKVYSGLMYDKVFSGKKVIIRSKMSFDHRMAPLIVIAEELGKSKEGIPEFREHFEIVIYDQGLNIWHHTYKDGKPSWHKAAFLKVDYQPKKIYDLVITLHKAKNIMQMTVECDGKVFGYQDKALPEKFYAGIIGCEGRCRFYDFRVTTFPHRKPARKPAAKSKI